MFLKNVNTIQQYIKAWHKQICMANHFKKHYFFPKLNSSLLFSEPKREK